MTAPRSPTPDLDPVLRSLRPEWPGTPDLARAVVPQLGAPARRRRRSPRPALAVVMAALLLAAGAVAAIPALREWVLGDSAEVREVPKLPPATRDLGIGPEVSLEAARRRAGFDAPWPRALDTPRFHATPGRFAAVSGPYLFTAFRGEVPRVLVRKLVAPGTTVLQVKDTLWIEGRPHVFLYQGPDGAIREERLRLAGNVFLWQRGRLLLRLEGAATRRDAVRLAATVR